ncbi:hypothetical protein [Stenotrophomonas sp. PS02289]|uniref:hypothetical protein n=1 Tax=Stenotrophomonas sp. PS02289 TaxID=2991422 RepID=UPI00249A9AAD|nr:hypothetical protein [Stenotrophomonas sp. PS02289]
MPLDDIAGGLLGGVFRFVVYVLVGIFFEAIIKGTGHIVLVTLRPSKEPSETACAVVGLLFWGALVVAGVLILRSLLN